jgi:hypothetical protein
MAALQCIEEKLATFWRKNVFWAGGAGAPGLENP